MDLIMSLPHILEIITFYGTSQFQQETITQVKLEHVFVCW